MVKTIHQCTSIFTDSKQSLGQGNVFTSVCQSFCSQGGFCMMSLPVWLPGPMFLLGVSVSGPMFHLGGLPEQRHPHGQRPIPLDRDPPPDREPPYGKERVVRILLECILVMRKLLH